MKTQLSIIVIILLVTVTGYGQDSARTINDKPGTPSSLRTPDNTPSNRIHTINTNADANQTINHQGVESNQVIHRKQQTIVPYSDYNKIGDRNSQFNKPVTNPDSIINNKPPNVSNPIHK